MDNHKCQNTERAIVLKVHNQERTIADIQWECGYLEKEVKVPPPNNQSDYTSAIDLK